MAHKLKLRTGLDRYDRHFPFFDGTAPTPESVALVVDQIGHGACLRGSADRHGANVQRAIAYSHYQSVIGQIYPAERLFAPSTLDTQE